MKSFDLSKIDYHLLFSVLALVLFGVVMVYSTSFYTLIAHNQSPEAMLKSGAVYAVIGLVVMTALAVLDYHFLKSLTWLIFIVTIVLSIAVLFIGVEVKGGIRWIAIPLLNIRFMPSEITKFSVILVFAHVIELAGKNVKKGGNFLFLILILGTLVLVTAMQRDFSTSALIAMLGLAIMLIGGTRIIYIVGAVLTGLFSAVGYVLSYDYAFKRISIWITNITDRTYIVTKANYQIMHSIYAIGSGGLLGKGFGRSEFKFLRLPEAYTDFIFAIISEEFGYIPVLLLLLTYIFIIGRIFKIAIQAKDTYGFILASGVGVIIALQVLVNIGVVIGLLPTTGITLPFISKGGTSLITLMSLIGVVLNISYQNNASEV